MKEPVFKVFEVVERTTLSHGQVLIGPEVEVATWYTSLDQSVSQIIKSYLPHGTSEKCVKELKTSCRAGCTEPPDKQAQPATSRQPAVRGVIPRRCAP